MTGTLQNGQNGRIVAKIAMVCKTGIVFAHTHLLRDLVTTVQETQMKPDPVANNAKVMIKYKKSSLLPLTPLFRIYEIYY